MLVTRMHSDTQSLPTFHCIRMFKGIFSTRAFFYTHRHAVYQCLKKPPTFLRHASVFKTRVSTRTCPFFKRAFLPIDSKEIKICNEVDRR